MVTPRIFRVWRTTYAISTKIARYVYHLNTCHWAIPEKKKNKEVKLRVEFPGVN